MLSIVIWFIISNNYVDSLLFITIFKFFIAYPETENVEYDRITCHKVSIDDTVGHVFGFPSFGN